MLDDLERGVDRSDAKLSTAMSKMRKIATTRDEMIIEQREAASLANAASEAPADAPQLPVPEPGE